MRGGRTPVPLSASTLNRRALYGRSRIEIVGVAANVPQNLDSPPCRRWISRPRSASMPQWS